MPRIEASGSAFDFRKSTPSSMSLASTRKRRVSTRTILPPPAAGSQIEPGRVSTKPSTVSVTHSGVS